MVLPKFLFIDPPAEIPGAGLILTTEAPCYMAKVLKFFVPEEWESFKSKSTKPFALVDGYMIAIQYFTTIPEINSKAPDYDDIQVSLQQMAIYYFNTRITPKLQPYKRNLIQTNF